MGLICMSGWYTTQCRGAGVVAAALLLLLLPLLLLLRE
jgi:hypothetical protein